VFNRIEKDVLMKFLYDGFLYFLDKLRYPLGFLPGKTGLFFRGRRNWREKLQKIPRDKPVIWIHAASTGEFEQAVQLIEKLKQEVPDKFLAVSFFSPSGFTAKQGKTGADLEIYLPLDTPSNAKEFVKRMNPEAAVFIKYEFWPNFLKTLKQNNVPVFLVSGIFRSGQSVFKYKILRDSLKNFKHFLVQDENSRLLLQAAGFDNVTVAGDTRFDTVMQLAERQTRFPVVESFKGDSRLVVAGSTWPADEDLLMEYIRANPPEDTKWFIIPHEPSEPHIRRLMQKCPEPCVRYSQYGRNAPDREAKILIGDTVGLLKYVYRYGDWAYVGGGFGKGIHNILEAAVYGKPVVFGPAYGKFREAVELLKAGGAFSVKDGDTLAGIMNRLKDTAFLSRSGQAAARYVRENAGATGKVWKVLKKYLN
jgi:3-deoxy-D-manno-octulosonic-acid transferase